MNLKNKTVDELLEIVEKLGDRISELEGTKSRRYRKGDIVRIVSDKPTKFTRGSEFKVGTICRVVMGNLVYMDEERIRIELPWGLETPLGDTINFCRPSQVELIREAE
jgi:hypothetical protein